MEKQNHVHEGHVDQLEDQRQHSQVFVDKAPVSDFKADAIEAENAEHNMTVLQAVKAYPMASFWALVMSCTIVSRSCHVHILEV